MDRSHPFAAITDADLVVLIDKDVLGIVIVRLVLGVIDQPNERLID